MQIYFCSSFFGSGFGFGLCMIVGGVLFIRSVSVPCFAPPNSMPIGSGGCSFFFMIDK